MHALCHDHSKITLRENTGVGSGLKSYGEVGFPREAEALLSDGVDMRLIDVERVNRNILQPSKVTGKEAPNRTTTDHAYFRVNLFEAGDLFISAFLFQS